MVGVVGSSTAFTIELFGVNTGNVLNREYSEFIVLLGNIMLECSKRLSNTD